jgi:hypothetical protein
MLAIDSGLKIEPGNALLLRVQRKERGAPESLQR